jgi:hypothetical protein
METNGTWIALGTAGLLAAVAFMRNQETEEAWVSIRPRGGTNKEGYTIHLEVKGVGKVQAHEDSLTKAMDVVKTWSRGGGVKWWRVLHNSDGEVLREGKGPYVSGSL